LKQSLEGIELFRLWFLTIALCLLMPISAEAKVGEFTGEDYLRQCTTTKPDQPPGNTEEQEMAVYCVGYIEGAITVLVALDGRLFCMPQNATPQDVLKATFAFMQAHPDQKQYLLASVMMAAAIDQWPCKTKQ
jgi:Rap1a immunity proteins